MSYTPPIGDATSTAKGVVRLTGDLGGTADAPVVNGFARAAYGGQEFISTNSSATGAVTLNLAVANVFNLTLTGNATFTFSGAVNGKACSFTVYVKQDGTGNRTVTWPSSVKWSGSAPTLSTTANALDILVFESLNGGTSWVGSLIGTNFA